MSDLNYIDKLVNSKLAGHAIETTGNSWLAISRIAFWRNFLIFSFTRFNVYYAALILLLSVSSILYLIPTNNNNTQQSNFINSYYQPRKFANTQNDQLATDNYSLKSNEPQNSQSISNNDLQSRVEKQKTSHSSKNNNLSNPNNFKSNSSDSYRIANDKIANNNTVKSITKSTTYKKNSTKDTKEDNATNKIINTNSSNIKNQLSEKANINNDISDKQIAKNDIISNENLTSINKDIAINTFSKATENIFNERINYGKKLSPLSLIKTDNLSFDERHNNNLQVFSIDSVDYYLPIDERNNWMLEFYLSPLYTNNIANSGNSELTSYLGKKQEIEKPVLSFTTGMNIIYQGRNNLIFQTGVSYSQLGEFISREDINEITHNSYPLHPQGGFFNIDTIQFYNIDSLLQGIEYIETVYDSAWVDDNTIINTSDTTLYKGANNRNKYSYFEIPVMVGYSLPYGQFNLQLKAGIITSIFINANGNKLNIANEKEFVNLGFDSPQYRQVNYSFVSGFDLNYQLSSRFDLSTGIYYRRNLFNIYDKYPYSQKYYAGEFHLGIKYHFQ